MSILCKIIQRGEPGVEGGGTKKYYASANVTEEVDLELLTEYVADACTVHGADIRGVLYALIKVIIREVANSKTVRLGEMGTIRVEISSEGVETLEEVSKEMIKKARVVFYPGKLIRKMLKSLDFKIVIEEEEA